jgi:hypothetical protein
LRIPLVARIGVAVEDLSRDPRAKEHGRVELLAERLGELHGRGGVHVVVDAVEGSVRVEEAEVENEGLVAVTLQERDRLARDVGGLA